MEKAVKALQDARGSYLSKAGKMVLQTFVPFADVAAKKWTLRQKLTPEERDALHQKLELQKQFARLESQFRSALLKERAFTETSLPTRRTIEQEDDVAGSLDKTKEKADKTKKKEWKHKYSETESARNLSARRHGRHLLFECARHLQPFIHSRPRRGSHGLH